MNELTQNQRALLKKLVRLDGVARWESLDLSDRKDSAILEKAKLVVRWDRPGDGETTTLHITDLGRSVLLEAAA